MSRKEEILEKVRIIEDFEKANNKNRHFILNTNNIKKLSKQFNRRRNLKLIYLFLFYITIILIIMLIPVLLASLFEF